jgi:hypothetical protein
MAEILELQQAKRQVARADMMRRIQDVEQAILALGQLVNQHQNTIEQHRMALESHQQMLEQVAGALAADVGELEVEGNA